MRLKDEDGKAFPAPNARLKCAPMLRQAGAFALATDSRSAIWNATRRAAVLNKVIDHVVDGDAIPKWVFATDPDNRDSHCLVDLWRLDEKAITAAWAAEPEREAEKPLRAAMLVAA